MSLSGPDGLTGIHPCSCTHDWIILSAFTGKVISILRGAGLGQPGVVSAYERLLDGDWVHVFPEGRVNQSGTLLYPLRWGVGKLIASVTANSPGGLPPLVLPIYHTGLDVSLPLTQKWSYIPRCGKEITVLFGEPRTFETEVSAHLNENGQYYENYRHPFTEDTERDRHLYHTLTESVYHSLYSLELDPRISTNCLMRRE
mmetsp:Transcript_38398/g.96601  ORF Transcript_38398/g.96601 Transcript_38398/m.96601 type:complete len:200 (-) Transcript_38398:33-632(-)